MMNGDGGRGRGRGRGRGGHAGRGAGRGGATGGHGEPSTVAEQTLVPATPVQPTPSTPSVPPVHVAAPIAHPAPAHPRPNLSATFNAPTRPTSPTLCKFGLKCSNVQCRWSHPSQNRRKSPTSRANTGSGIVSCKRCQSLGRMAMRRCAPSTRTSACSVADRSAEPIRTSSLKIRIKAACVHHHLFAPGHLELAPAP